MDQLLDREIFFRIFPFARRLRISDPGQSHDDLVTERMTDKRESAGSDFVEYLDGLLFAE